jgi:hypothetical protein
MTDPYATTPPLPYDPEAPETYPVEPIPAPELEHLSAEEAIARQAEVDAAAAPPAPPDDVPKLVWEYEQSMAPKPEFHE